MKEFIAAHGLQATVLVVVILFNTILTAVKSAVETLEAYLAPGVLPDPNSKLEKVKAFAVKGLGITKTIIDWLTGNKSHE